MKNRLLTLLIAAAMLLTPVVAFADDEADNSANQGAAEAIESGAVADEEDAAIDEEAAENTENAEFTDEDEFVQLSPKGLGVASIGANEDAEEWGPIDDYGGQWNKDRTKYRDSSGTVCTGLFLGSRKADGGRSLYYADASGIVAQQEKLVAVSSGKRYVHVNIEDGRWKEEESGAYTYLIMNHSGDFFIQYKQGVHSAAGAKYYVMDNGTVRTNAGIQSVGADQYYIQTGGVIRTTPGFVTDNGKIYYVMNSEGRIQTTPGLINYGGDLYVLQADHSVCTNIGIARVGANLYYVSNSSGVLARNISIKVGKKTCHVQANGIVAVGSHKWKKKWYYSTADGYLKTKAGIVKFNGKRFYVKKGGKVQVNKKFKYKKKTYVAGKDGAFKTGVFKWKGAMYYASKKGVVRTKAGMVTYKNYSYYVRSGGKIYKNTQFKAGGKKYLADSKGRLVSGIYKWKGKYYYADASYAVRRTAGIIKVKGKYYYNKKGGGLAKNKFVKYNDAYYYAGSDAVIKTSTFTYKGITITPSSSGVVSEDDYYRVFPEKKNNTSTDSTNTSTNSAA